MDWITCIYLLTIVFSVTNVTKASCRKDIAVRSSTSRKSYNRRFGYETYYPTLYYSINCSYVSLTFGQTLEELVVNYLPRKYPEDADPNKLENFKFLYFDNSRIATIAMSLFNNFTSITHLYINSSGVEQIQPGGFNGLSQLQVLQLGNNHLTEITKGVFNHLTNLITLNFSSNHINMIERHSFMGLLNLENLLLGNNKIIDLLPDTFPYLRSIKVVDLSYNMIIFLPENMFSESSQYSNVQGENKRFKLNLSFNNLTNINTSQLPLTITVLNLGHNDINNILYVNSRYLNSLFLNNNNISNIIIVDYFMTYLDLTANNIHELNSNLFQNSTLLRTLNLSNNLINKLHEDVFLHLDNLNTLSLDHNQIGYIPIGCFSDLTALKFLNISGNKIVEFEYGTFTGLNNLLTLDISSNTLMYLYESTFHSLHALEYLYIDHNLITTFDPYDFIQQVKSLKKISLNYNPWNCKSLLKIFSHLKSQSIVIVEASNNKVLNVHGIACNNNPGDSSTLATPFIKDTNRVVDLKEFDSFFNKEFFNTSFYQYFKNYSNKQFREEEVLNNFMQTVNQTLNANYDEKLSTNLVIKLNNTLYQFITALNVLSDKISNSNSVRIEQLEKQISKMNIDSKNSAFEKHSYNDSTLTTLLAELSTLKQFFHEEFKNSSFYKFFEHSNNSNVRSDINDPQFEKFMGNDDHVVSKLPTSQNNINALLVIIIIILLGLLAVFAFKSVYKPLNNSRKQTYDNHDSHSTLELL